jgi:alpha-D-xyloside xylohydrolase
VTAAGLAIDGPLLRAEPAPSFAVSVPFAFYEDEGVHYHYEDGAKAIIPVHWDERKQQLRIRPRQGSFPGMIARRKIQVTLVDGRSGKLPTQTLIYNGTALSAPMARQ